MGLRSVCSMPRSLHNYKTLPALTAALPVQVLVFGTTPQVRQAVLHGLLKQSPQAAAAPPPRAARQMPMLAGMGRPSAAEDGDLAAGLVRDSSTEAARPLVAGVACWQAWGSPLTMGSWQLVWCVCVQERLSGFGLKLDAWPA